MALKASSEAKNAEHRIDSERRKAVLVLISEHLTEYGYVEAAATLEREGGVPLTRFEAADNVDLTSILREYEAYYEFKMGKKPKLIRKIDAEVMAKENAGNKRRPRPGASQGRAAAPKADGLSVAQTEKYMAAAANAGVSSQQLRGMQAKLGTEVQTSSSMEGLSSSSSSSSSGCGEDNGVGGGDADFGLSVSAMTVGDRRDPKGVANNPESIEDRLLKPLPFAGDPDLRSLAQAITRDIFQSNPGVTWDDVVSLGSAKRLLKEAVVMPVKYPQLFTGLLSPWQGILLYGPPGTGKTMLAKAVATECKTTFFNISASSIVSKYRGDSEKLVRVLFELARYHAPSTIFLDEIDAIMGQRGGFDGGSEHEGSRRMKTELLIQMDGLAKSDALVFVLAASNIPWELDMALLRRLEKRVLVTLPDETARQVMLEKLLLGASSSNNSSEGPLPPPTESGASAAAGVPPPSSPAASMRGGGAGVVEGRSAEAMSKAPHPVSVEVDLAHVAKCTEGFSGSDIRLLCKEVAMKPVRRMMSQLEQLEAKNQGRAASAEDIARERAKDPITAKDMEEALRATRPSAQKYSEKYDEWQRDFGAV